jgi:hypothetical protein
MDREGCVKPHQSVKTTVLEAAQGEQSLDVVCAHRTRVHV